MKFIPGPPEKWQPKEIPTHVWVENSGAEPDGQVRLCAAKQHGKIVTWLGSFIRTGEFVLASNIPEGLGFKTDEKGRLVVIQ